MMKHIYLAQAHAERSSHDEYKIPREDIVKTFSTRKGESVLFVDGSMISNIDDYHQSYGISIPNKPVEVSLSLNQRAEYRTYCDGQVSYKVGTSNEELLSISTDDQIIVLSDTHDSYMKKLNANGEWTETTLSDDEISQELCKNGMGYLNEIRSQNNSTYSIRTMVDAIKSLFLMSSNSSLDETTEANQSWQNIVDKKNADSAASKENSPAKRDISL